MEGSATLTMDASRTTTNCAAASRASANQRLSVDVDDAEDKGGSWGGVTVIDLNLGLRAARPHRGLAHIEGLGSRGGALGRVWKLRSGSVSNDTELTFRLSSPTVIVMARISVPPEPGVEKPLRA